MSKVVLHTVKPYLAIFDNGVGFRYTFDGVDQYATIPPYNAFGKPRSYVLNFNAVAVATGTEQFLASGTEGGIDLNFLLHATLPQVVLQYRSDTGTQSVETVTLPEIVAGQDSKLEVITLGSGSEVYVNGVLADIIAFEASDALQPPLTHLGVKHDLTGYFAGELWGDYFIDDSPIQDTDACMGDGTRYVELDEPIELEDLFTIEVDCIWQDSSVGGVANWFILGESVGDTNWLALSDQASASPGRVELRVGGAYLRWDNALDNIALGQHFKLRIERTIAAAGGTNRDNTLYIDDTQVGSVLLQGSVFPFTAREIGNRILAGRAIPVDSALQSLRITDITNDREWLYTLDEGDTHDTGPELFTDIDTLSGATWDGTTLTLSGLNATAQLVGTPQDDTEHHIKFDYNVAAGETVFIRCGGGANQDAIVGPAVGFYDEVLVSQGTAYLVQLAVGGGTSTFADFSVKEAVSGQIAHDTGASGFNNHGTWTDTDWQFIPNNSRHYPINEGPDGAGTIVDTIGGYDGTIVNYDPAGWD